MDENEKLIRHLKDLSHQAENRNMYTFSSFLSLAEQDLFLKNRGDFAGLRSSLEGGSPAAERKIAVFGSEEDFGYAPELPLTVLNICPAAPKFAEDLTHRDYLGSILGLGIERELTGDIIIRGKTAWVICLESISDFLCTNLTQVRHTSVNVKPVSGDIPELQPEYETLSLNVASERCDAVIAAFTNLARAKAQELFRRQMVFVNGQIREDGSKPLKEGDIFSVRGFGKAVYDGLQHETKKGRLYVLLRKYV